MAQTESLMDTVECLECGRLLKQLPKHLKHAHGMSSADYQQLHPAAPVVSDAFRARMSMTATRTNRRSWQDKTYRKKHLRRLHSKCSDPVRRSKASRTMKVTAAKLWSDPEFRERRSLQQRELMQRQWQDPAFRKAAAESHEATHPQTRYIQTEKAGEILVQSTYEERACRSMDQDPSILTYSRGPTVSYVDEHGLIRWIYVDFRVIYTDGSVLLLEVKSDHYMPRPHTQFKLHLMKQYAKEHDLLCDVWNELELGRRAA